jgi:HK97 family phage major capsid protein
MEAPAMSQVLYDRRAQVWDAQKALLDAAADRTLSGEEKHALEKMDVELEELDYAIRAQEKGAEKRSRYDAPVSDHPINTREADNSPHPLTPEGKAGSAATRNAVMAAKGARGGEAFAHLHEFERAFDSYLRKGMSQLSHEQRGILERYEARDLSIGTNTAGGYTVPPGFLQKITDAMKAYGGMLDVCNVIDTDSGQPLVWPTADDTGNVGVILAENTAATAQDVTFGQKTLSAYMYSSKIVKVSYQLLQDSAFDLNAWLPGKFAARIGRAINAHFTNGTGGGTQPTGLVPNLTVGKTGATGQTLTVNGDDLIDLIHSIDPAYRTGNSRFMLNDASVKVVRKLKDTTGQYLWQPGLSQGAPDSILGYPVTINQDMPVMAANAKSIAFGDFNAAYVIRRVQGVQVKRFDERFADALQVGFLSFARYDGAPDDLNAAKLYQNSAT